jgi:hypothetical protein
MWPPLLISEVLGPEADPEVQSFRLSRLEFQRLLKLRYASHRQQLAAVLDTLEPLPDRWPVQWRIRPVIEALQQLAPHLLPVVHRYHRLPEIPYHRRGFH